VGGGTALGERAEPDWCGLGTSPSRCSPLLVLGPRLKQGGGPGGPLAPWAACGHHAGGLAGPLPAAGWVPREGRRGQRDPCGEGQSLSSAGNPWVKVEGSAPTHPTSMAGLGQAAWHWGEEEEEGSLCFNPSAAGAKRCQPGSLLFSFWFRCRAFGPK